MKKNNQRKKLSEEQKREQLLKRAKANLKRKIYKIFTNAGFNYIPTGGKEVFIGHRKVEVDALYIYENIWVFCEDTVKTTNIRDHIRTKNEAFGAIQENVKEYMDMLRKSFPEKVDILTKYDADRIKTFSLYIPRDELNLSDDDYSLFNKLKFVQPKTLDYFYWIVNCIRLSARFEIFRFLDIKSDEIGLRSSSSDNTKIKAPIIYPREFTGLSNDVRLVSFMMSAEDLLNTCYVLRKDNWSESIWLYQRLIDKNKIKKIREFLEVKGEAFYNNIIVVLPDSVIFQDAKGQYKTIDQISNLDENCQLILPKEMNSVCLIDGQHRVYAHYESGIDSKQEKKIAVLRPKLHLLVTGLIFPKSLSQEQRAKIQSEIFLDINSNATKVPQNVLLQIKRIKNPLDDESIAQFVIEKLNKFGVFNNLFQMSSLDKAKIKTASIVKFALRYLVTINPVDGKKSLIDYWDGDGDKVSLRNADNTMLTNYVKFCADSINIYFSAIKKNLSEFWDNENSKLLSVISINSFIIAFNKQLEKNGIKDFDFYDSIFKNWTFDFTANRFPYTSSQYHKFALEILKGAFDIVDEK